MVARHRPIRRSLRLRLVHRIQNPVVAALLRSPVRGRLGRSLVLLRYTGRRTGTRRTVPVMYARDGDELVVAAAWPDEKRWWRNLREPAAIDVLLDGRWRRAVGSVVDQPDEAARVFAGYLRRFPRAAPGVAPDDPDGVARAAAGVVIVRVVLG